MLPSPFTLARSNHSSFYTIIEALTVASFNYSQQQHQFVMTPLKPFVVLVAFTTTEVILLVILSNYAVT